MASLKDVRVKIGGVKKTKQITKAMNMVASAKLRGAQARIAQFSPYADKFFEVIGDLASKSDSTSHPLLEIRNGQIVAIMLVTSDRGLCGSFNISLINKAFHIAKLKQAEGKTVKFYCIGKKGRDAARTAGYEIVADAVGQMNSFDFQLASKISNSLLHDFLEGAIDEAHIVYGHFHSMARQEAESLQLLPIATTEVTAEGESKNDAGEYTYEPSVSALLAELLPRFVKVQVYRGLLDTSASEHAARMVAMDNATRNCDDIVSALTLVYNKTRQASITTDLMDIVAGAEALNG